MNTQVNVHDRVRHRDALQLLNSIASPFCQLPGSRVSTHQSPNRIRCKSNNFFTPRNKPNAQKLALPNISKEATASSTNSKASTRNHSSFNAACSAQSSQATAQNDAQSSRSRKHHTSLSQRADRSSANRSKHVSFNNEFVDDFDDNSSGSYRNSAEQEEAPSDKSSEKKFKLRFVGSLYVDVDPQEIKRIEEMRELKKEKKRLIRIEKEKQNHIFKEQDRTLRIGKSTIRQAYKARCLSQQTVQNLQKIVNNYYEAEHEFDETLKKNIGVHEEIERQAREQLMRGIPMLTKKRSSRKKGLKSRNSQSVEPSKKLASYTMRKKDSSPRRKVQPSQKVWQGPGFATARRQIMRQQTREQFDIECVESPERVTRADSAHNPGNHSFFKRRQARLRESRLRHASEDSTEGQIADDSMMLGKEQQPLRTTVHSQKSHRQSNELQAIEEITNEELHKAQMRRFRKPIDIRTHWRQAVSAQRRRSSQIEGDHRFNDSNASYGYFANLQTQMLR